MIVSGFDCRGPWPARLNSAEIYGPANRPPSTDPGGPYEAEEGHPLRLDGSGSSDPDGDDLTYEWDVDYDGTFDPTLDGRRPEHVYGDGPATHDVALRVTDEHGAKSEIASTTVRVDNVAPRLTIDGPARTDEGDRYTMDLGVADPGDDAISHWDVDWGDGSTERVEGNPASVAHTFADGPNDYAIAATAADEDGTFAADSIEVAVANVAPTVSDVALDPGGRPGRLTLHAAFADPGVPDGPFAATIDWGDGTAPEPAQVDEQQQTVTGSHVYRPGDYAITVAVTDEDGDASSSSSDVRLGRPTGRPGQVGAASAGAAEPAAQDQDGRVGTTSDQEDRKDRKDRKADGGKKKDKQGKAKGGGKKKDGKHRDRDRRKR
jgi:PKD repeat protein